MTRRSCNKINTTNISDQAREQLEALLRQECNYQCVDYTITEQRKQQNDEASMCRTAQLQPSSSSSSSMTTSSSNSSIVSSNEQQGIVMMPNNKPEDLIHLLEECAFLVTDTRFMIDVSSHLSSSSSSSKKGEQEAAAADSSFTSSSSSLKRVGSMVSFKGIHEEATAALQHQQQQEQEHEQHHQRQHLPSGEDLAYWRRQMMEWAFLVVASFEMDKEVVAVAFNLLDRYVPLEMSRAVASGGGIGSTSGSGGESESGSSSSAATVLLLPLPLLPPITRDDYQLYAMTCLYTAVKIREPYPRKLAVEALVAMSRDFYTAHDVICTELDILKALQWHVNPPTAMTFARHFVHALLLLSSSSSCDAAKSSSSCSPPSSCFTNKSTTSPSSVIIRAFVQMDQQDVGSNHGALPSLLHQNDNDDSYALCTKITEVALADPFFLSFPNSTIGLAAVLHAVRLQGRSCKALLKALQTSKIVSTTTTTTTGSATSATATTAGEEEHVKKNQISGSELEVVYARLEKLLLSS